MQLQRVAAATLGFVALATGANAQGLIISEIVDAPLPGGLPKFVELTNCGSADVDLSGYTIGNFNNGGTNLGGSISLALPAVMLPAGGSYVLSYESSDAPGMSQFFTTYGFDADNLDQGSFINGDDVIVLFLADGTGPLGEANGDGSDATLYDVYGDIGVDGSNMPWEYTDSYAQRLTSTASAVFNLADWDIPGFNTLEGTCAGDDVCEEALVLMLTSPGSHTCGTGGSPYTSSCFGDGGNGMGCTDCPCGNNAASGSGGGCLNSAGNSGTLVPSGVPSVANDTMRFDMTGGVSNAFAILSSGDNIAPNNAANPCFGLNTGIQSPTFDGLRCAVGGILRHGTRPMDANGDVGVTTNGWGPPSGPPGGLIAANGFASGQTRHFQIIYREDIAGGCMTGLATTQSVSVTFEM